MREVRLLISHRPAEAADRAVSGHRQGDLIIDRDSWSAIGTLVERSSRFVLLHLPGRHTAKAVRDAMLTTIAELRPRCAARWPWDQGVELAQHARITSATGLPIYFWDPHSPWQRSSNETPTGCCANASP